VLTIAVTAGVLPLPRAAQAQNITVPAGNVAALISAITTANGLPGSPATIHVSGTYTLSSSIAGIPFSADGNNGLPSITTDVTIEGTGVVIERDTTPGCTINSSATNDEFRIFHVASTGKLTLNGITVRNGCADGGTYYESAGGGIFNLGETDLHGSTVSNNQAITGGGIYNFNGTVNVLDQSLLSENNAETTSAMGGGIASDGLPPLDANFHTAAIVNVTDSVLSHNATTPGPGFGLGGGISNFNGQVYLTRSTIADNTCGNEGGGVYNSFATADVIPVLDITACTFDHNTSDERGGGLFTSETVDIVDSTFSNNSADVGGAIWKESTVNATNCTFSGNHATTMGGGIYNDSFDLNLTSCTFSGNYSPSGGAIFFYGGPGTLNITNSIVANSPTGGDCAGPNPLSAAGANFDTDGTCKTAAAAGGTGAFFTTVTSADLNLGALALNPPGVTATHALMNGSVAIDAVPAGQCTVDTDQRGVNRPQGERCDSGAYERFVPGPAAPAASAGGLILLVILLALVPWYQSRRVRTPLADRETSS